MKQMSNEGYPPIAPIHGPIHEIALQCCNPTLVKELMAALDEYLEFAKDGSRPTNPFALPDNPLAAIHFLIGGGIYWISPTNRHANAVAQIDRDFKERISSGEVRVAGVQWEPEQARYPTDISQHWAEALSFDWARNAARLRNFVFINLRCSMRPAKPVEMQTPRHILKSLELRIAGSKPFLLIDDSLTVSGRAAHFLAELWPLFRAYREGGGGPEGDLAYTHKDVMCRTLKIKERALYRVIERLRALIRQEFQGTNGEKVADDALVQTLRWKGYRINPTLIIGGPGQTPMSGS